MPIRVRAAAAALLALLAFGPWHAAAACSLTGFRGVRRPGESHLIALPTDRVVSAARGMPPHLARLGPERSPLDRIRAPGEGWWWRRRFRALWGRVRDAFRPDLPYGQVVRLERLGGPDSLQVLAALARSGGEAVLVHWALTAGCGTALSESLRPWLPAGERVFIAAALRDEVGWVGGRPTFDVGAGEYPYRERSPSRREESRAEPRLSIEEYWDLYEALPAYRELEQDSAAALAPLRAWSRAHPELASHPLVRGEISQAEGYADMLPRLRGRRRP